MFKSSRIILFLFPLLLLQCSKEDMPAGNPGPSGPNPPEQSFPIQYQAQFPEGKLPYPHHDPELSEQEHQQLIQELFIVNNYGQYQCGDAAEDCYFHDGLDMVLDNGTPIYAIKKGIVRANIGGNQYYRTLVVEDLDEPGFAWSYTHVYHFNVSIGEEVSQGQFLGRVNFQGLDHIHLSRTRLREGGSWDNFSDLINIFPDDFFILIDETPPVIQKPFHFFKDGSNEYFEHGEIDTISGAVDIVVSIRDAGQYAGGWLDNTYFGDRLCVKKIEYRILRNGEELLARPSFDFSRLEFAFHQERWKEVNVLFKHHSILTPDLNNFNKIFSHYIINQARDNLSGTIDPQDAELAWDTKATDDDGQALFPNGLYQIEVTAYDTHNNATTQVDDVFIKN